MPEFLNPFPGMVPRNKMNKAELIRALRLNLAAELEAIHLYTAHADATDDELAKKVLLDIADEERQHAGEFLEMLRRLTGDEQHFLDIGQQEVAAMAASITSAEQPSPEGGVQPERTTTIGSLRGETKEEM